MRGLIVVVIVLVVLVFIAYGAYLRQERLAARLRVTIWEQERRIKEYQAAILSYEQGESGQEIIDAIQTYHAKGESFVNE